jgi:anti-sigma B factor antagonist
MSAPDPSPSAIRCQGLGPGCWLVAPAGGLDLTGAANLKWALTDRLEHGAERIALDLSQVSFIDSTGLSVLISVKRRLEPDGDLVLVDPSDNVTSLLQMTGLEGAFKLFRTLEDAVIFLEPQSGSADPSQSEAGPGEVLHLSVANAGVQAAGDPRGRGAGLPLSGDTAIALGIATTAMPFARSADAQAVRWLRILRRQGDAGVALRSLGIRDEALRPPQEGPLPAAPGAEGDPDPVGSVARVAERLAGEREAESIGTLDLLRAVRAVCAPFDRMLTLHAADPDGVIARVDQQLGAAPPSSNP